MNRAAAIAYLTDLYGSSRSPYLTMAEIALTDTANGLAAVIDDALLAIDVAYSDLATAAPSNVRAYRATLRYMALRKAWGNLNQMPLIGKVGAGTGVSVDSVDWRKQIPAQMVEAQAEAISLGVDLPSIDGTSGWAAMGDIVGTPSWSLDYLEPVETM